jgi:glucose/arabinose dehydrogenase
MPSSAASRRRLTAAPLLAALLLTLAGATAAQAAPLRLHKVGSFDQPDYVTAPPGDRRDLFVVERSGIVRVVRDGHVRRRPFLNIRRQVDLRFPDNQFRDQGGLASLAFSPDYRSSGRLYVLYSHAGGTMHVDELRRSAGSKLHASAASRRTVLTAPRRGRIDLGGQLQFGPDGYLYVGLGQGGADPASSQDLGQLTGKILRIDPTPTATGPYSIPPGNPFAKVPGARPEVYYYGLRVPWRFSFDRPTGNLVIGDVGEESYEEVDVLPPGSAGANLGWPYFEGRHRHEPGGPAALTFPALVKPHGLGNFCAIVGGYIGRGGAPARLHGRYIYGDVCTGRLRSVRLAPGRARGDRAEHRTVRYLDSFGRDARGRLYAVSLFGPVYRIAD